MFLDESVGDFLGLLPSEDLQIYSKQMFQMETFDIDVIASNLKPKSKVLSGFFYSEALVSIAFAMMGDFLEHAKTIWEELFTIPLISRKVDNTYKVRQDDH